MPRRNASSALHRSLPAFAGAALLLVLSLVWAVPGDIGYAAYEGEAGHEQRVDAALAGTEQRGWAVLGALAVPAAVAALGLLAAAARPPDRRGLAGLTVLVVLAAAAVGAGGFSPDPAPLTPLPRPDFPPEVDRVATWAPAGALVALALGLAAMALAVRPAATPGAPLLVAGAVLLAGSLSFPWELVVGELLAREGRGLGYLGILAVPLAALAAALAGLAFRPARRPALAALIAVCVAAGLVLARGFRGGLVPGPYCALLGLAAGALGLIVLLLPVRARGPRQAAVAGALALAATPFLPWGAVTGASTGYEVIGAPGGSGGPGFTTAFDIVGGEQGPLLWLVAAAAVLAAALPRERPHPVLLYGVMAVSFFGMVTLGGLLGDETYASDGLNVATAGAGLSFAGLLAIAVQARRAAV